MKSFRDSIGKFAASRRYRPAWRRYSFALLVPTIAFLATAGVVQFDRSPFFTLMTLAVLLSALYGGRNAGYFATLVASLLTASYLPPKYSLRVPDSDALLRIFLFALGASAISFIVGILGDIQRRLEFERQRLFITLASIGDCVISTDRMGRVTFLNRMAEHATGWTLAEAQGRQLEEVFAIINETTRTVVPNPVRTVIETGTIAGLANHTLLVRRDGTEIPIDDSAAPIYDAKYRVVGVVLVFRDITEQKRSEAAFLRAEKLATVGRMAATIAHEINNPLEAICNLLFLIEHSEDIAATRKFATMAMGELRRATHVSHQTLAFARQSAARTAVDIGDTASQVISLFESRLKSRNIRVVTRLSEDAIAEVSGEEVRQVISNLVGNAIDSLPANGTLYLRTTRSTAIGTPRIRLTVADTGTGIAPQHLPHLFDPFFSTKKDVGTGLGLWITRTIVEAHDGCIHLRTRPGKGTVMTACWPLTSQAAKTSSAS